MGRMNPTITDAEWAVLEQLWRLGRATVRQLADVLYPKGGPSEYATVHRLLERLEAKGAVHRERGAAAYEFRAAIGRDEAIGRELEALAEKLSGGSLQPLLSNLVRTRRVTADELRELLALVQREGGKRKPKEGKGEAGGKA
jgi:predicted transcriptional regulator